MTARQLYQAGQLDAAIQALGAELRNDPANAKQRTFLFELLCFAGDYDRAEKHLEILAAPSPDALTGALLYKAALAAERTRNDLFQKKEYPADAPETAITGTINGQPFESLEDADPRIGARLEVYAAGDYLWLALADIASVEVQAPKNLRDLLWVPALIRTGPAFKGRELGQVLIPAIAPFSFRHADDAVRLGRSTVWDGATPEEAVPFGLKMLLVDGEEFPILELRNLEITAEASVAEAHASAE